MNHAQLIELLNIGKTGFVIIALLLIILGLVYFFTRHLKNEIHRVAIFCFITAFIGLIWQTIYPFMNERFHLIHGVIRGVIWTIFLFSSAYLCTRIIDRYVWNQMYIQEGETTATTFLRSMVAVLIYLVASVLFISVILKQETYLLTTFMTAVTVIFAYSGSDVVKELFAGVALNMNPAFRKGHIIKITDQPAKILDINWRYVVLVDIDSNLMYMPNTEMFKSTIYNFTGEVKPTRIKFTFHTHTNVPPQLVIDLLMPELKKIPHLAQSDWFEDNVVIHIQQCDSHSMKFEVRLLIEDFLYYYKTRTTAYKIIWYTLSENKIPMYAYTMRVDYKHAEYEKISETLQQFLSEEDVFKLLRNMHIFKDCSIEEIKTLAQYARVHEFVPTQPLFLEGEQSSALFVIASGNVQLIKHKETGDVLSAQIFGPGQAVGIHSVITGEKHKRTAIADNHVLTYAIDREVLKPILQKNQQRIQDFADEIVREETLREQEFEAYTKKRTAEQEKQRATLIGQIREFLGIVDAPNL